MSAKTLNIKAKLGFDAFSIEVDENIELNGIIALFGPSGSGKSTLLRVIAGLEAGAQGKVTFNGQPWADTNSKTFLAPHLRPVGLVFQDGRLFPHLNVEGNLRYAEKRSRTSKQTIAYSQVVEALDLSTLLPRKPASLSGGERQRVTLGRTLLTQPELLLLDEPMSALDVRRKGELLPFIEKVPDAFGVPMIFVSHAVDEVVRLADEAIILVDGKVSGRGPMPEIFQQLKMHDLTGYFEAGAVVEARVTGQDNKYKLTSLLIDDEPLQMPMVASLDVGDEVRLRIRSRDVSLATKKPVRISTRNALAAIVDTVHSEPNTAFSEVTAKVGLQTVRARITRQAVDELGLKPGKEIYALIKGVSFDRRVLISAKAKTLDN